jgi:hypothetical protein
LSVEEAEEGGVTCLFSGNNLILFLSTRDQSKNMGIEDMLLFGFGIHRGNLQVIHISLRQEDLGIPL